MSKFPSKIGFVEIKNSDTSIISNSSGFCLTKLFTVFIKFCAFSKSVWAGMRDNFFSNFSFSNFSSTNLFSFAAFSSASFFSFAAFSSARFFSFAAFSSASFFSFATFSSASFFSFAFFLFFKFANCFSKSFGEEIFRIFLFVWPSFFFFKLLSVEIRSFAS